MRPDHAERLLGGHATGILSEAERRELYAAALAHQEVFDALMDEEALRDLLSDPASRARLLAALAASPRPRAWWRRPLLLSSAASLLLVVATSLVLVRRGKPELPPSGEVPATEAAKVAAAPEPASEVQSVTRDRTGTRSRSLSKSKAERSSVGADVPPPPPPASAPLAGAPARAEVEEAKRTSKEVGAVKVGPMPTGQAGAGLAARADAVRTKGGSVVPGPRILVFRTLPGLPLEGLRADLASRLRDPALAVCLREMPEGTRLDLRLAGADVVQAAFDRDFPRSGEALRLIRAWRFEAASLPAGLDVELRLAPR